jgi:hypothetical protein
MLYLRVKLFNHQLQLLVKLEVKVGLYSSLPTVLVEITLVFMPNKTSYKKNNFKLLFNFMDYYEHKIVFEFFHYTI